MCQTCDKIKEHYQLFDLLFTQKERDYLLMLLDPSIIRREKIKDVSLITAEI